MLYELASLSLKHQTIPKALADLESYATNTATGGQLLGCWEPEHGVIFNQLLVLRGFPDHAALWSERNRLLASSDPFGIGDHLLSFTAESYVPFPFIPPVRPGSYGGVYEFRTYHLKIGGLAPTMAGWQKALPERTNIHPLITNMYALDGVPRITHIWPFPSLNDRLSIRREAAERGLWPPENGPENIAFATSTIAMPTAISPLT
jgi:hypothetical protein